MSYGLAIAIGICLATSCFWFGLIAGIRLTRWHDQERDR